MCHVSETPFINEDPAIQSGAYDETKTLAGKGYGKCQKVEKSRLPLRFSDPTCEKSSADSTRFPWRKKKKERKAKINSRKILHLTKDNHFLRKKNRSKAKSPSFSLFLKILTGFGAASRFSAEWTQFRRWGVPASRRPAATRPRRAFPSRRWFPGPARPARCGRPPRPRRRPLLWGRNWQREREGEIRNWRLYF